MLMVRSQWLLKGDIKSCCMSDGCINSNRGLRGQCSGFRSGVSDIREPGPLLVCENSSKFLISRCRVNTEYLNFQWESNPELVVLKASVLPIRPFVFIWIPRNAENIALVVRSLIC